MWRIGVFVVLALLLDTTLSDTKSYGVQPLSQQRLKRAPYYCPPGPPGPPGPPFWPPPPPPPFWPPPPPPPPYGWPPGPPPGPPPFARQQDYNQNQYQNQNQIQNQNQYQSSAQSQSQAQSQSTNDLNSQVERLDHQDLKQGTKEPCENCSDKNSAVSNAESESGTAVAIAIARIKTKKED